MSLFRLGARVGCLSPDASRGLEEWPHIRPRVKPRRRTEPGLQALWHSFTRRHEEENPGAKDPHSHCAPFFSFAPSGGNNIFIASYRWLVRLDGETEAIGRLGLSAVAVLRRQEPLRGQGAAVRPGRLQRDRRPSRSEGSAQPRALVFLRGPCGGI